MRKAPGLAGGLVSVETHFGDIAIWEQLLHLCIISFECQIPNICYMVASHLQTWQQGHINIGFSADLFSQAAK